MRTEAWLHREHGYRFTGPGSLDELTMREVDRLQADAILGEIQRSGLSDAEIELAVKHTRGDAEVPDLAGL